MSQSVACIFGSIVGGFIVEYSEARYTFLIYAVAASVVTYAAHKMNPQLENSEWVHQLIKGKHQDKSGEVDFADDDGYTRGVEAGEQTSIEIAPASAQRETFCGRIKADWKVIKENMKSKVVWRYYLFWVLRGLQPSFGSYQYFQFKEVYKLTQVEYGTLTTLGTISMLIGVWMYQKFFKDTEMRTLQYYCNFLTIGSLFINLA